MKKLDPHTELVLRLFAATKTYSGTHRALNEQGIEVSFETVRDFLRNSEKAKSLPKRGKGRPRAFESSIPVFPSENTAPPQTAGELPLVLHAILDCPPDYRREVLIVTLRKAGMAQVGDAVSGDMVLNCERVSRLSDLELIYVAYLASEERSPVGLDESRFVEWMSVMLLLASRVKARLSDGGVVTLGQLCDAMYSRDCRRGK